MRCREHKQEFERIKKHNPTSLNQIVGSSHLESAAGRYRNRRSPFSTARQEADSHSQASTYSSPHVPLALMLNTHSYYNEEHDVPLRRHAYSSPDMLFVSTSVRTAMREHYNRLGACLFIKLFHKCEQLLICGTFQSVFLAPAAQ